MQHIVTRVGATRLVISAYPPLAHGILPTAAAAVLPGDAWNLMTPAVTSPEAFTITFERAVMLALHGRLSLEGQPFDSSATMTSHARSDRENAR